MATTSRPFGASDSDSDDSQTATETQLAKEEADIERELQRLQTKRKIIQAKRNVHYRQFLAATKVKKCDTPGSGGSSNADTPEKRKGNAEKRKAAVHDLREAFENRTIGLAGGFPQEAVTYPRTGAERRAQGSAESKGLQT